MRFMLGIDIGFVHPWYLALLVLLPLVWGFSFHSLAGLGRYRRLFALAFRSAVFVLIVLALAEVQTLRTSDKLTVTYLLDQSASIPAAQRQAMLEYVRQAVARHRNAARADGAGVIVFGREAVIEVPPFDDDLPPLDPAGAPSLRTDATNLAAALNLAGATFPENSAKRVVIVSDGNENIGDARAIARLLADQGVGIDVVPVRLARGGEIQVEEVVLPADIRRGQPLEARVVIDHLAAAEDQASGRTVRGKLRLLRQVGPREELLNPDSQDVELQPGKNVFTFPHRIDEVAAYTYKAVFVPDDPQDDRVLENNQATAFTQVRGKGRVLLIEDADNPGGFDHLAGRLRANNLEVAVQASDALFTSLAELQAYDCVVLANVPRSSGADASRVSSFSDEQIRMLAQNTEQFGCGLVLLGGEHSFGAGGWANTPLEAASPVDFTIDNAKVIPSGALVLVIDKSGSMAGEKIAMCREAAAEAVRVLGPRDHIGVVAFDGAAQWLVPMRPVEQRQAAIRRQILRLQADGGTDMFPGMRDGFVALQAVDAAVKHMIVLSDGQTQPGEFGQLTRAMQRAKITVSTVAVGSDADRQLLASIAQAGGGRTYQVTSPRAIPRIFIKEAMRVARPLIKELRDVPPQVAYPHEILQGIAEPLPPLTGFVMTTVKQHPLVEVALRSPEPPDDEHATVLAAWTYGLGRTAVLTTDAGQRWANAWTAWENYDKFFAQLIRWAMRPSREEGKFSVATDVRDGQVRAVVTALDQDDQFLNFLRMSAVGVDPDLEAFEVEIEQIAPGRYVGQFPADKAGSYFLNIVPGAGQAPLLAGVTVPYSSEFRDRQTNRELLRQLAVQRPRDGRPGQLVDGELEPNKREELLQFDPFRHDLAKAISRQDIWPLVLVITAAVFFGDVLLRRVSVRLDRIGPALARMAARILRRQPHEAPDERLQRLRSRKAEIREHLGGGQAAARFEPPAADAAGGDVRPLEDVMAEARGEPSRTTAPQPPEAAREPTYTERLLEAKKKAWKDQRP